MPIHDLHFAVGSATAAAVAVVSLLVAVGACAGAFIWCRRQWGRVQAELKEIQARRESLLAAAEVESHKKLLEMKARFEAETAETRAELKTAERRLAKREDELDRKLDVLNTKERKIEQSEQELARRDQELAARQAEAAHLVNEQRSELLRISKLTPEAARSECLLRIERDVEREAGQLVERILTRAQENAREKARQITIDAIQRYASEHTSEATVATVDVPSDEMKGRIIGREGRNIRAFEKETGVSVVVDDTPGIVSVTCFNPVRKEVARLALERLVKDGRIHPTRIEELVAETQKEVDRQCSEAGQAAAMEVEVHGLNRNVVDTLGRLHFRTSYGQNVLRHSVEVASLCGVMAAELGLDEALARRCGLLHDIGKALDHDEAEGPHTKIGAEFCKKFNEHAAVINAVAGHHADVPATHPYTPLVMAADAMSASRPGSRRESLEKYIKRLKELEDIARSFPGVRLAHAVEAGREVRVIVDAVQVDDRSSLKLARDIAGRIEESMTYPGEIKVTVLREIRAVEYAR